MAALTELEQQIPALRRYAWSLLRDGSDADDLVQSCLVQALDRMDTRKAAGDLRPWLFAIMHNLFVSRWRRLRRRGLLIVQADGEDAAVPASQGDAAELHEVLRRLDSLPEEHRQVLLLVAVEGLDYAATAAILDIPVGTVMSRLSRARDRLRDPLDQPGRPAPRPAPGRVK